VKEELIHLSLNFWAFLINIAMLGHFSSHVSKTAMSAPQAFSRLALFSYVSDEVAIILATGGAASLRVSS
jgi:hypothetical protein